MTQYVRPLDLHNHTDSCEVSGCIAVVPIDEHQAVLSRLDETRGLVRDLTAALETRNREFKEQGCRLDRYRELTITAPSEAGRICTICKGSWASSRDEGEWHELWCPNGSVVERQAQYSGHTTQGNMVTGKFARTTHLDDGTSVTERWQEPPLERQEIK